MPSLGTNSRRPSASRMYTTDCGIIPRRVLSRRNIATAGVPTVAERSTPRDLAVRVPYPEAPRARHDGNRDPGADRLRLPPRALHRRRRDGANCPHPAAQKIIAVLCFGSACCLLAVERESAVCAGRLEGESV